MASRAARAPDPPARGDRLLGDRAPPRALRRPLHEHRGAGRGRGGQVALALVPAAGARGARADLRDRPRSHGRRSSRRSPTRRRRSRSRSTSRARCRPMTSSRPGSSPPSEAIKRFLDAGARQVPRGTRHVLVGAVRRVAADARSRARARVAPCSARRSVAAPRSATRSPARSSCCSRSRRPTATARRRPRPAGSAAGRSRRAALGDPAALRRRADARHARSARRRGAREVVRDPGLHDRARHARRHAQLRRLLAPGAARPRDPAADRRTRPAASSSRPRPRRASTRSTRISPRGSAKKDEWRELSFALVGARGRVRCSLPARSRCCGSSGSREGRGAHRSRGARPRRDRLRRQLGEVRDGRRDRRATTAPAGASRDAPRGGAEHRGCRRARAAAASST